MAAKITKEAYKPGPLETDLEHFSKPENYTGTNLHNLQNYVIVKDTGERTDKKKSKKSQRNRDEKELYKRYRHILPRGNSSSSSSVEDDDSDNNSTSSDSNRRPIYVSSASQVSKSSKPVSESLRQSKTRLYLGEDFLQFAGKRSNSAPEDEKTCRRHSEAATTMEPISVAPSSGSMKTGAAMTSSSMTAHTSSRSDALPDSESWQGSNSKRVVSKAFTRNKSVVVSPEVNTEQVGKSAMVC